MSMDREIISIGMGEIKISKQRPVTMTCIGLGSCIGFCAYDPLIKVGGMAHMVLPENSRTNGGPGSAKYVNSGIRLMFTELEKLGASRSRLKISLSGGARMFSIPGLNSTLDVGSRNVDMAEKVLATEGIRSYTAEVGGNQGRTMSLFMDTGRVFVRTTGQGNIELK
jgi:chemotaxis protein CheD